MVPSGHTPMILGPYTNDTWAMIARKSLLLLVHVLSICIGPCLPLFINQPQLPLYIWLSVALTDIVCVLFLMIKPKFFASDMGDFQELLLKTITSKE